MSGDPQEAKSDAPGAEKELRENGQKGATGVAPIRASEIGPDKAKKAFKALQGKLNGK